MKIHTTALATLALLFTISCTKAQHTVKKLWETDHSLATPESVLFGDGILYVSQIKGSPWQKDGKGGIAKVSTEGKIIDSLWITGLDAPKGLAKNGNWLYVADMDSLVVIDIKKSAIAYKVKIEGDVWLNDPTVDTKGIIYVTDSKNGKVFKVDGKTGSLYLEGLKGINGIKAIGNELYIVTGDGLYKPDAAKKLTKLGPLEKGGDGIEPVGNGDFIVTAWEGIVYYFRADGTKDIILDTHADKSQTADIGYDAKDKIIYVPTFFANSVAAYKLD